MSTEFSLHAGRAGLGKTGRSLFSEVLARKERADATRNALALLGRLNYKQLFALYASLESSARRGEIQTLISDYLRVRALFADSQIPLFQKSALFRNKEPVQ